MPYPAGNIAVVDARLQNISGGMQWNMQQAEDIRFLAVSGTITIGASRARYDFTLVEYHLHIDEVPWIIFSTLDNALGLEFTAEFWEIVNFRRKERWGFLEVPWIADKQVYDVAAPYPEVRMSIFNNRAHTIRVVRPFIEGSLEVKLPTIWTDEKQSMGEAETTDFVVDKSCKTPREHTSPSGFRILFWST